MKQTIEEKKAKHERAANPMKVFKEEAIEAGFPDDEVLKDVLYYAFCNYCKYYTLPVQKYNAFCGDMKRVHDLQDKRIDVKDKNGKFKKISVWTGIRLKHDYSSKRQKTLDDNDDID